MPEATLNAEQDTPAPRGETIHSPRWRAVWFALVFLAILTLPAPVRLGAQLWELSAADQGQLWVWGGAFLLWAVLFPSGHPDRRVLQVGTWLLVGVLLFAAGYACLRLGGAFRHSRAVAGLSVALALVGAAVALLATPRWLRVACLAGAAVNIATVVLAAPPRAAPDIETRRIRTALHELSATTYRRQVPADRQGGGAIEPWADGYLLATARGDLYRIGPVRVGQPLTVRALPLKVPLNLAEYLAHDLGSMQREPLRVTGILVDEGTTPHRLVVAHQHWDATNSCLVMRVSVATLPSGEGASGTGDGWTTRFESQPCLPIAPPLNALETGGRLARSGKDTIFVSIGSHGFDGLLGSAFAQDSTSGYGKVWLLAGEDPPQLFSRGHRNPQGLVVARDGVIWSAEHGPAGGDELNILVRGGNYGWPLATYGTQYGLTNWPLAEPGADHQGFVEPRTAFVPSVAPSSLIQVSGGSLSAWDGDLIIGTLAGQSLYRMRVRQGEVRYAEPIRLGQRIRSLAQGRDGGLLLWTDRQELIHLSPVPYRSNADSVFQVCSACHGATLRGDTFGPSLQSVLDRPVASLADFPYSEALQQLGGRWTRDRLDAFLRNPPQFAPGTSMRFTGVEHDGDRRALLDLIEAATRSGRP